ncbi:protein tyrosine phosphatase domain-containing protein 1-like isoform X2 [Euwallacea fornicatus]|uniref:protein tyrosine phosphatase domain-containing protein 1-like isoform X2 n=1 Tax=Euwallacea fornicatus TaxID=995702 RepID=UPI00338D6240
MLSSNMNLPELRASDGEIVQANYNKLSDHIRRLTPHGIQCSVFCGGLNCKYENPENWKPDSLAIHGIYSHWITDDILAMARPSTMVILQKNVIQQFESLGIKSIINLQCPKEHASCGQPLESSGFSYDPNVFMEQNIYYYNFAWKDYGDATLEGLLNMVKVIAFALTEGRVAIHCHAGLGRTGVLIACYLVFSLRVSANDAIRYVRLKRSGSVQTRGQILCVRLFAQFILPQTITYFLKDNVPKDKYMNEFTLHRFLRRQKIFLHGYEERNFKYLPKIVYVICERILKLCACNDNEEDQHDSNIPFTSDFLTEKWLGIIKRHESCYSISSLPSPNSETIFLGPSGDSPLTSSPNPSENGDSGDNFSEISTLDGEEISEDLLMENICFQELETQRNFAHDHPEEDLIVQDIETVFKALLSNYQGLEGETRLKIRQYQNDLNTSKIGWMRLALETDLEVLTNLLFEWLEGLKVPILQLKHFEDIVILYKQPEECFQRFDLEECYLLEYILKFLSKLQPIRLEVLDNVVMRLIGSLSKQTVLINSVPIPSGKGFKRIGDGTLSCSMMFFKSMLELVEAHHRQDVYSLDRKISENEADERNEFDNSIVFQ